MLFPISQSVTHTSEKGISDLPLLIRNGLIKFDLRRSFTSLDYDSWAMGMAVIDYAEHFGVTYGRQLLGSILFFVPREFWKGKPIGTGAFVAEKRLMTRYQMWFSNLSCPLFGEAYINFGIVGVIIFGFVLGLLGKIMDFRLDTTNKLSYKDSLKVYICLFMFFMLRGDLMSSFAYLVGTLFALLVLPVFIESLFRSLLSGGLKGRESALLDKYTFTV